MDLEPAVELDPLADPRSEPQVLAAGSSRQRTRHRDRIAQPRAAPAHRLQAARLAHQRHVDRQLPRVAGHVPAHHRGVELPRRPLEAGQEPLDPGLARVPRDHDRDDREGRIAPHRPDVAQAAGDRLVADLLGARLPAVEVDAVDDAVGLEENGPRPASTTAASSPESTTIRPARLPMRPRIQRMRSSSPTRYFFSQAMAVSR